MDDVILYSVTQRYKPSWSKFRGSSARITLTEGSVNDDILISSILASLVYTQDTVGTTISLSVYVTVQVILKASPYMGILEDVAMSMLSLGKSK